MISASYWWRRRESNPRPEIFSSTHLHVYPEFCFSSLEGPLGTGTSGTNPLSGFASSPTGPGNRLSCCPHLIRLRRKRQRGAGITPPERTRNRWRVYVYRRIYELPECSTCSIGLNYPRRNLFAPFRIKIHCPIIGQPITRQVSGRIESRFRATTTVHRNHLWRYFMSRSSSRRWSFLRIDSRLS
jgi:hypothetical protein